MPFPVALIPALFQAGVGAKQLISGNNELKNLERPEYKMPTEMLTALGLSKAEFADPRFAGQSRAEAQAGLGAANALQAAQNRGSGMQLVGQIAAAANNEQQAITAMAEQSQRADQTNYQNMLGLISQYREKEFQMNEFSPYMDKYNEAREQRGAGQENIFGALDSMAIVTQRLLGNDQGYAKPAQTPVQSAETAVQSQKTSSVFTKFLMSQLKNIPTATNYWNTGMNNLNKAL